MSNILHLQESLDKLNGGKQTVLTEDAWTSTLARVHLIDLTHQQFIPGGFSSTITTTYEYDVLCHFDLLIKAACQCFRLPFFFSVDNSSASDSFWLILIRIFIALSSISWWRCSSLFGLFTFRKLITSRDQESESSKLS